MTATGSNRPFALIAYVLAMFAMLAAAMPAGAADYYTPRSGSAERKAIMDAARVPVTGEIGQRVIFVVSVLRTDGDWAYLQATPRKPDGSPLDWMSTRLADDWQAGIMSDVIMVLLRRSGSGFQVVGHIVGPTDVAWYDWVERYGLPEALFWGG